MNMYVNAVNPRCLVCERYHETVNHSDRILFIISTNVFNIDLIVSVHIWISQTRYFVWSYVVMYLKISKDIRIWLTQHVWIRQLCWIDVKLLYHNYRNVHGSQIMICRKWSVCKEIKHTFETALQILWTSIQDTQVRAYIVLLYNCHNDVLSLNVDKFLTHR